MSSLVSFGFSCNRKIAYSIARKDVCMGGYQLFMLSFIWEKAGDAINISLLCSHFKQRT